MSTQTRNQEATVYIGNLDERVSEALLWELMLQAAPVVNVFIPRDRVSSQHQGFGFVEFNSPEEADYASKVMNLVKLFDKPIRVNKATTDKKKSDVGANLFIGNLAPEVDEKLLQDTFATFGTLIQPGKIGRDVDTGTHKGFGFVSYDNFESADSAIQAMNGQWLCNKQISVSYAFKKDGRGERHGTAAERLLAAQARKHEMSKLKQPSQAIPAAPGFAPQQ
jgi:splicing factor 3B subunit 4